MAAEHRFHDYTCRDRHVISTGHSYCPKLAGLTTEPWMALLRPGTRVPMYGSSHINSMALVIVGALSYAGVQVEHTVDDVQRVPECSSSSSSAPTWRTSDGSSLTVIRMAPFARVMAS